MTTGKLPNSNPTSLLSLATRFERIKLTKCFLFSLCNTADSGVPFIPYNANFTTATKISCSNYLNNTVEGIFFPEYTENNNVSNNASVQYGLSWTTFLDIGIAQINPDEGTIIPAKVCDREMRFIAHACATTLNHTRGSYGGCANNENYNFQACWTPGSW